MSNKLPDVPKIAQTTLYPAGVLTWSNTVTKLPATTGGFVTYGWTPDQPPGAQEFNRFSYDHTEALRDLQTRTIVRFMYGGNWEENGTFAGYMPLRGLYVVPQKGVEVYYGGRSNPLLHSAFITPAGGVDLNGLKVANYRSGTTSKVGFMPWDASGATPAIDILTDSNPPVHSYGTLPQAGAKYTHGTQDVTTGRAVYVAGNSALAANAGFASGDLSALTFVAAGAGVAWVAQPNMSVASKPGEVRAFSKTITFASTDGGVTCGNLVAPIWTGGTPAGNMFPPVWDEKYQRWVCAVSHQATSTAISLLNSKIYTSADGVTWTLLASSPASTSIMHIAYHSGVLLGITRFHNNTPAGGLGHGGLEVLYSLDGGATWKRPGIELTLEDLGYGAIPENMYHHQCGFTKCGAYIMAQTVIKIGSLNPGTIASGLGTEFAVIAVHGDDSESV